MKYNIQYPLVVIGAQWGDEGKGKIVDLLAAQANSVVRYNGGNNAGHSVVVNGEKYKLSLIPSGVMQRKKLLLAQGVVIDPKVLLEEIAFFEKRSIPLDLMIDPRVQIVMPYHKALDAATEAWKGKKATGSLHLGIGYCYEDKNNRFGIRFEDLIEPKYLKEKLEMFFPQKKKQIEHVFNQKSDLNEKEIFNTYVSYGKKLKKYLGDVSTYIGTQTKSKKKKVLFEGAHGTFLDPVFGTYPYTVAIHTISGAVFPYVGIAPQPLYSMGIVKAYTTRVGNGPFPTELLDTTGETIREVGGEFGTVSKRPRRCGWLDLCMLRTAHRLSGFSHIALTKLDVLSSLSEIKICTHYKLNGKTIKELPASIHHFPDCKPVYKTFKGWKTDISKVKKYSDLPPNAKKYIEFVSSSLQVPISILSVGPGRGEELYL